MKTAEAVTTYVPPPVIEYPGKWLVSVGDVSPTVVAVCDLSIGTDLRYSARVVFDKRDAAEQLCNKLQDAGDACIVLKN